MMIKVIMPSIAPDEIGYKHFNYHILGEDMVDVIKHIIKAPGYALGLLYTNHTQRPNLAIQKWDTLLILFFAGGYMLIWRPKFLLMVFPVLCMKMWSDDPQKWTPALHYSVEFIPILCLAVFGYWIKIKKDRFALLFSLVSLIFAIGTTVYFFEFRFKLFWRPEEEQFYRAIHYERNIDLEAAYEGLESLPADAMVSAQGQFVPHVAMRRYITLFPFVRDANYIVLNPGLSTYPHAREFYEGKLKKYRAIWETIYEKGGTLVLRRPPGWIDPDQ